MDDETRQSTADGAGGDPVLSTSVGRWLAAFAVVYSVVHHQGFVLARLGSVPGSGTRWADWIDLATPVLVLGPAAMVLVGLGRGSAPRPNMRVWAVFAVGALLYVQGHGIHLAANSVSNLAVDEGLSNRRLTDIVHLWDELVGHYLWYGGFSVVVIALVVALRGRRLTVGRPTLTWSLVAAMVAGSTYATNALEGHFAWPGLGFVGAMTVLVGIEIRRSRRTRSLNTDRLVAELVFVAFVSAVLVLGFYGCWHRGFPDPSSVGWNPLAR